MSAFFKDEGGLRGSDEDGRPIGEIYHMGIIDFFQEFTLQKKLERSYKTKKFQASLARARFC